MIMSKKNTILSGKTMRSLAFLSLLGFLLSSVVSVPRAQAAPDTDLYFDPASDSVTVNDDFNLVATIDPGTNAVSAVELHVTFDQTKLRLDSITPSSAFSLELEAPSINNTNGTASIAVGVPLSSPSVTTVSAVATFAFHALAVGTNSPVTFTNASLASADGESGDVIVTRTPASVTISAGADTTPPVRSAGSPSGALAAGTTSTTVSLTTDEYATCKYATTTGVAYASMTGTFSTTAGTSHSFTASGLTNGGSYAYSVRCEDGSTNANTDDYTISFSVASPSSSNNDDDDDDDDKKKNEKEKKERKITESKKTVRRGDFLIQRGMNFSKNSTVALYFSKPNGTYYKPVMVKARSSGSFMVKYRVTKSAGKYKWYAVNTKTGWKSKVLTYTVK